MMWIAGLLGLVAVGGYALTDVGTEDETDAEADSGSGMIDDSPSLEEAGNLLDDVSPVSGGMPENAGPQTADPTPEPAPETSGEESGNVPPEPETAEGGDTSAPAVPVFGSEGNDVLSGTDGDDDMDGLDGDRSEETS